MMKPAIEFMDHSDGYRAMVRWWRPENPRGAVLYFHGIQSHGGWYEGSGAALGEAGFTVLMPDRRGSGLNQQDRGHAPSAQRLVDDSRELLAALLKENSESGAHLVGVSWGGKLCLALATDMPQFVRSISLVAPGLFPKIDISTMEKFRVALSLVADREKLYDIPLNDPRLFTANAERIRYVAQDELKLTQVTASFLISSRRLDRLAPRFAASDYREPVHLFLAGHDKIIDNERTKAWLRKLPVADRQITEYSESHHTLEFEPGPSDFFDCLCTWIRDH